MWKQLLARKFKKIKIYKKIDWRTLNYPWNVIIVVVKEEHIVIRGPQSLNEFSENAQFCPSRCKIFPEQSERILKFGQHVNLIAIICRKRVCKYFIRKIQHRNFE